MRQGQHDVVGVDHAQVTVDGPGGVEHVGARAGRVEGARDLLADVGRLAGAGDGDAAGAAVAQVHGLQERVVEPPGDLLEGGGLAADDLAGVGEPVGVGPPGLAVEYLQGMVKAPDLAERARVYGWDGETPLGRLRLASWDDNFVSTYKVANYQLEPGVSCQ